MIISWFSGGVTSAVATKIALSEYENVLPVYLETGGHHSDMQRFLKECEEWFGANILVLQDKRFKDHMDLCEKKKVINFTTGAECSRTLKKKVRQKFEEIVNFKHQVFGFEFARKQINRSIRFQEQYPYTNPLFPLIDKKLTKGNCMSMVERAGIKLPEMYSLGFNNNNCVGCVKGGKGYWSHIKETFPEVFNRMAIIERKINRRCLKDKFLDELEDNEGRHEPVAVPECDWFCELELENIESSKVKEILQRSNNEKKETRET